MTFDATITWTTVINALVAVGGVIGFIYTMKGKLDNIADKFKALDEDVAAIRHLLTTQVRHDSLLERLVERVDGHDRDIHELRRGEGFIFPLQPHKQRFGPGETL